MLSKRQNPATARPPKSVRIRLSRAFAALLGRALRRDERLAAEMTEPGEANEREMPKRRHCAPLDDAHAAVPRGPLPQPLPAEFRPPAKPPRERREPLFEGRP